MTTEERFKKVIADIRRKKRMLRYADRLLKQAKRLKDLTK